MRISFLGPAGTYSEIAALMYAQPGDTLVPQTSLPAVVQSVESGMADAAMMPIENVLEGAVTVTLDLLIHDTTLMMSRELVVPIQHQLLGRAGQQLADVEVVYGHPQSLGQCRHFLEAHLPHATILASLSNSAAPAEALASNRQAVAIGTVRAAELTGASIIVPDIQDSSHNVTRFVALTHHDAPPTGDDKTSLGFGFNRADHAGQVVRPLQVLADAGINMTKLESRPSRVVLGEYIFLVDINGHRLDPHIAAALQQMRELTGLLKIFGSYPRWQKD